MKHNCNRQHDIRTSEHIHILGCNISYQEEKDIHSKITTFLQILGLLNNTLKPNLVQRSTRLKLYKTLALPTLSYGSET
jgi:hypothetical protein